MLKYALMACVLSLAGCGAGNNSAGGDGNSPRESSTKTVPQSAREAADAYVSAMATIDAAALKELSGKADQERIDKDLEMLKEGVEKIVITETSLEQTGEYWVFTYSQVAHFKDGKTDGDDRKVVYVVNESGHWKIVHREPK